MIRHNTNGKPHIFIKNGIWLCKSRNFAGSGVTPYIAYRDWRRKNMYGPTDIIGSMQRNVVIDYEYGLPDIFTFSGLI